jgi:hypothetical protein
LKLILANAVSFQLVWLATVAGAAKGLWWAGPLAALLFAAWQVPLSAQPRADLKLMLCAAAAGFVVDSALVLTGLLRFETALPWAGFAPVWIVSLWVAFALTLNHSLAGLKHRPLLAVGLGLIGGPLAYGIAGAGRSASPALAGGLGCISTRLRWCWWSAAARRSAWPPPGGCRSAPATPAMSTWPGPGCWRWQP